MIGKKLFFVAASTSVASFLFGSHYSDDFNAATTFKRIFPFQTVKAATALVAQPSSLFELPNIDKSSDIKPIVDNGKLEFFEKPSRAAEIMVFGYPGFDNLRTYSDFVLSYNRQTRTAHWVVEHLSPERMIYDPSVNRSKCMFRPDDSIHSFFQSQNSDYFRSGYDRGHLAAAANHRRTQDGIDQTFFLTNMSPQVGKGFNRDKWNDLEKHARRLAIVHPNVYICTGPLYLPHCEEDGNLYVKYKVIGQNCVAVPTHFFKVILFQRKDGHYELESYLLPNAAIPNEKPISDFLIPLDTIERPAGFLIFEKMPHEKLRKINGQSVNEKKFFSFLFNFWL